MQETRKEGWEPTVSELDDFNDKESPGKKKTVAYILLGIVLLMALLLILRS